MPKQLHDVKIAILTCPFEPPKPKTKHKVCGRVAWWEGGTWPVVYLHTCLNYYQTKPHTNPY